MAGEMMVAARSHEFESSLPVTYEAVLGLSSTSGEDISYQWRRYSTPAAETSAIISFDSNILENIMIVRSCCE